MSAADKDRLVPISTSLLHVGAVLRVTLRDEQGRVLLAKGMVLADLDTLETLQRRASVFVSYDESDEAVKALLGSLNEATRRDAPLKDIDRYTDQKPVPSTAALPTSPAQAWGELESRLKTALSQLAHPGAHGKEGLERIEHLVTALNEVLQHRDRDAALFVLIHRAITGYGGYSALHSLVTAVVSHLLVAPLKLSAPENDALVRAALTMNVAMLQLQDQLATQKHPPSTQERTLIDAHAHEGERLLQANGVTNPLWLAAVQGHHDELPPGTALAQRDSAERLTKVLQVVDRYTASMSPRASRGGRDAKSATRAAIVQRGETSHDEVGLALMQVLGLHPAGTFVKLASGETAVVLRRGAKANEPWVASILNRRDEPIAEPRLHNTAKPEWAVVQAVSGSAVRVRLNLDAMLRALAFSKTGAERPS